MAEKTEKATPKKLRDARKKGQVAKSKDFPSAFTFATAFALIVVSATFFFRSLAGFMVTCFSSIKESSRLVAQIPTFILLAIEVIFDTSLPFMALISIVGVLVNFLIVGPLFSMQAMKPDIKRLNPITNLKGMFKIKTFIELLKSIAKIAGAVILIYSVVFDSLPQIISTAGTPIMGAAIVFSDFLVKVAVRVGLFFLVVAIADLVFQKKNFAKEMKMEKFEVKQELKDTEGNPEIKGKRRQIQQELAYQEGPRSVKRARAVITNPIHIAVALEYEAEEQPAPKIIIMGKGITADNMLKVALEFDVPIIRNVTLAQELYNKGQVGHYVPEETYEAIAEVLKWLNQLEKMPEYDLEVFK